MISPCQCHFMIWRTGLSDLAQGEKDTKPRDARATWAYAAFDDEKCVKPRAHSMRHLAGPMRHCFTMVEHRPRLNAVSEEFVWLQKAVTLNDNIGLPLN